VKRLEREEKCRRVEAGPLHRGRRNWCQGKTPSLPPFLRLAAVRVSLKGKETSEYNNIKRCDAQWGGAPRAEAEKGVSSSGSSSSMQ
jgi:hypothetical protein